MSSFLFTNSNINDLNFVNYELSKYNNYKKDIVDFIDFKLIYNYFLTEDIAEKYFFIDEKEEILCVYDGILVENNILNYYKKYGESFYKHIDGEYAVVVYDKKNNLLIAATDPFGCRHLSIGIENKKIGVSTFKIALEKLNFKNIYNVYGNTVFTYNTHTKNLDIKLNTIYDVKNPFKKDFSDWNKALEKSIFKKIGNLQRVSLTLSDGYDSGLIHCALIKNNIKNDIFSINKHGLVDSVSILLRRHEYHKNKCKDSLNKLIFSRCKDKDILDAIYVEEDFNYDPYNEDFINLFKNDRQELIKGVDCIAQIGKLSNSKVVLSGVEGEIHYFPYNKDEFTLNYSIIDTARSARTYCSASGLDARFVLLDKDLYQETQWLDKKLFRKEYKSLHKQYMDNYSYPYYDLLKNKKHAVKNHLVERTPYSLFNSNSIRL